MPPLNRTAIRAAILRKPGRKPDPDKTRQVLKRYYLRLGGYREWGQGLGHHLFHHRKRLKTRTDQRRAQAVELRMDAAYARRHGKFRPFREIAREIGISHVSVYRHWKAVERMQFEGRTKNIAMERGLDIHELLSEMGPDPASSQRLYEEALRCGPRSDCQWFRDAACLRMVDEVCFNFEGVDDDQPERGREPRE